MNALRKLARDVAKRRMKKAGMQKICKPIVENRKHNNSKFADHWKDYVRYKRESL